MRLSMKDRRALKKNERAFLDFARSYLSEGFPNPDREGCPPDDALRSLAFNPGSSQLEVTEHLAACSPCFRRYSELLDELKARQQAAESNWSRISVWSKAHPVLAGTAASGDQTTKCSPSRNKAKACSSGTAESHCGLYAVQPGPERAFSSTWGRTVRIRASTACCPGFDAGFDADLAFGESRGGVQSKADL